MKKLDRINELVDELNELKLGCMAASLDSLYHSKSFDELDAVSLLEQVIGPEYQNKTSQRFQNRLKRAHLAGGPQSLDKCKDSTERVYLPSDINATLSSLDFIANVKHFFTLLGKMFFTSYGKEFFSYSGKQIFTS